MKLWTKSFVWLATQGVIRGVEAVADCAPATGSLTIKSPQDVSSLASCTTFTGNIVVAADGPQSLDLKGLTSVKGNIDVENVASLDSLSSSTLETVATITLNNLPKLSTLSFPSLKNFSTLNWANLPSLETCEIARGSIEGEIQHITIFNTSLQSLDWLTWPIGAELNISSNTNLQSFIIPYDSINANSALTLVSNPSLKTVNFTSLSGIYGGLEISGNVVDSLTFPKLEIVGGYVQLKGDYSNISMPALSRITGALSVTSTLDIQSFCDSLSKKELAGHYDCTPNVQGRLSDSTAVTTTATTTTPTATTSASPTAGVEEQGPQKNGIKIGIAATACFFVVVIAIFAFIYYRRKRLRAKVQEIPKSPSRTSTTSTLPKTPGVESVELGESSTRSSTLPNELETPTTRLEMAADKEFLELPASVPQEMEAGHGHSELEFGSHGTSVTSVASARSTTPLVRNKTVRHEMPA